MITGGTQGIGFEVAKALALANARVFLLSRKEENAQEAVAKIKEASSGTVPDVTFLQCDLGNLREVRRVADSVREKESRLDLVSVPAIQSHSTYTHLRQLICDAGVGVNAYAESSDGIDRHMSVNHFGHMLLVNRLLPLLRSTARLPDTPAPRIVSVSSELHRAAPSNTSFESVKELNDPSLSAVALYGRSKLAIILFTKFGLEDRVLRPNHDNIIAIATHPGAVATGQQDQFKEAYGQLFGTMLKYTVIPFMRAADQGSLSTLWAATSDDVERQRSKWDGKYITDPGVLDEGSKQACDPELGARLWKLSEEIIKEKAGEDALLPWDEGKAA